jgi:glycosyltransferase involved in cell wall biosynthesis
LLEALASGAFPVVTDIPSNREWIADGDNGLLVPIENENVLAKKIIDATRDKTLVERSRKENLSLIKEKVLWSVNIEKIKKMYSQL